jgi:uncharacterized membrane protein
MIVNATFLGDTWRLGVTLLALLLLSVFWYVVVSRITPFPGPGKTETSGEPAPNKYPRIQRVTVICDVVLFVWIVVEGAVVIPIMMTKYGLG